MGLANNFSAFFKNRINDICAHIGNNENEIRHRPDIPFCKLNTFEKVTLTDMKGCFEKSYKNTLRRDALSNKGHKRATQIRQTNYSFSQNTKSEFEKWNISRN